MLRSPVGLSYAVVSLLGAIIVSDVLVLIAAFHVRGMTSGMSADRLDPAVFEDLNLAVAEGLSLLLYLATGALFIIWFHRVRKNAGVFGPDLHRGGPGWAIGSWFIPIANIWLPRGVAADTWRASRRDPYGDGKAEPLTVLNLWWLFFVLTQIADFVAGEAYDDADTAEEFATAAGVVMGSAVLDIVAAVLAALFVRHLTAMQHAKALRGPAVGHSVIPPGA
ncbi:DUF4328 domain-containing protein [Streptomyces sp. NPDC051219]|uniref:DUF4328 domain-containing protein n=1 Tax=Streptomyces sp. NPDC051219 TaxID=3155283 RepID=UPI00344AF9AF